MRIPKSTTITMKRVAITHDQLPFLFSTHATSIDMLKQASVLTADYLIWLYQLIQLVLFDLRYLPELSQQ